MSTGMGDHDTRNAGQFTNSCPGKFFDPYAQLAAGS